MTKPIKPFYVNWNARDALDGMMNLSETEELAYRRLLDMIYASNDELEDNDESLKWSTKAGSRWPKVKKRLLELGKIEVIDGRITNPVCRERLAESRGRIAQAIDAGNASAESRKQLKLLEATPTGVATAVATGVTTGVPTGEATKHQTSIRKEDLKTSPLTPHESDDGDFACMGFELYDVTRDLSEDGLAAAKRRAPGYDVYRLAAEFSEAVRAGKLVAPREADKAFPAWCGNVVARRRQ